MAQRFVHVKPAVKKRVFAYRRALKRARIPKVRLFIFGSQATGKARSDSDIDVAVVSPSFGRDRFQEGVELLRLRRADELFDIEPHPFHPDDLEDRWDSLAQEVKRYGIELDDEA